MTQNNAPRLLLAGTGSGCSKTTVTTAILRALQRRGVTLSAFKCGPDYIDPMFHTAVLGVPSRNLDLFFEDEAGIRSQLARHIQPDGLGVIEGVTDRDYYTNSFHVPVYYSISAFDKIDIEAPYHVLTNAGHISYVELDGDPTENLDAFEAVVRHMKEAGIGYGSVNHPVDRDPVCGYNGIIGDVCPKCGRAESDGVAFERIRRITGYLVGTMDRWNDAKTAEEADRVKHSVVTH